MDALILTVHHGRLVNRAEPHHIDAEVFQVVDFASDAFKIANTIAIGIFERTGAGFKTRDSVWAVCVLARVFVLDLVAEELFPPGGLLYR